MSKLVYRSKNRDWASQGVPNEWQYIHVCILQDLRDELQALNRIMQCSNVARGFRALSEIASRDEKAFKRRVENAVAKRIKRTT